MQTELKIDFQGTSSTEPLEQAIRDHVTELEQFFGRLTACHVVLKAAGRHHRSGGLYNVHIHLTLPDGREVNVGRTPRLDERHSKVLFAIGDAFRRARRQLQDRARKLEGHVKAHETQPLATIARFDRAHGYGFLQTPDGREIYFHQNSVVGAQRSRIAPGVHVTFVETTGEKGPQASTVRLLGKHAMRVGV